LSIYRSIIEDVLLQLKFNMELDSISTHALYRVEENAAVTMIPLSTRVRDLMEEFAESRAEQPPKILFRSWVCERNGIFEKSVLQEDLATKQPSTAVWLKYMEEVYMTMLGKYVLTEEESVMLGVLKMQVCICYCMEFCCKYFCFILFNIPNTLE
jgi:hypothetical protein